MISHKNLTKYFRKFLPKLSHVHKVQGGRFGLAITKSLVELQRGHIWVESEVGNGSRFYFTLPTKKAEEIRKD